MHVCGVTGLGVAYCWGKADEGGLGNGTGTPVIATTPVAVSGGLSFAMLSAGGTYDGHSCGVTTDGAAYCWGRNFEGQLGNGMTTASGVPVKVAGQP
jgi:alpha-tubulin suppressor-like RCC1 family protein